MNKKYCKNCKTFGHTQFYCNAKPKKPLKTSKPLNKHGKVFKQWIKTRDTYFDRNPPDENGFYYCYIPTCAKPLLRKKDPDRPIGVATLDHIVARTRNPSLRFKQSNLAPCCYFHNKDKGSLSLDQYLKKLGLVASEVNSNVQD
jgi:5-methylcytosine-specific restriction endonuclease McrA